MYSNVKFYKKDNELHEVHFPVRFGRLKGVKASGKNEINIIFQINEIDIILLMFAGSQDLYLGVYTDLTIGNREKYWITHFKC